MLSAHPSPILSGDLVPYPKLNAVDICIGADPYVFKSGNLWHLLLQENTSSDPLSHHGIQGYTLRTSSSIDELVFAPPAPLSASVDNNNYKQVWAGEIHFDKYLYVAASNGQNYNHRMHVYQTNGSLVGPWQDLGRLSTPKEDDYWAIDMTFVEILYNGNKNLYAVWSGWQCQDEKSSQDIYIAQMLSPTQIGPRHLIASPTESWCSSVAPILEGPQSLVLDGQFIGLIVTGNASWTECYSTRVLKYISGDPLNRSSWRMAPRSLFEEGYGIGHGVIVEDTNGLYYVGHRKTSRKYGWEDRVVFHSKLDIQQFYEYLNF